MSIDLVNLVTRDIGWRFLDTGAFERRILFWHGIENFVEQHPRSHRRYLPQGLYKSKDSSSNR